MENPVQMSVKQVLKYILSYMSSGITEYSRKNASLSINAGIRASYYEVMLRIKKVKIKTWRKFFICFDVCNK